MCDICADFSDLLNNFSDYDNSNRLDGSNLPLLKKKEIDQVFTFIQTWLQRQCFCCFRDPKNYEKFHLITQSIIVLVVKQLKSYRGEDVIHSSLDFDDKKLGKRSPNEVKIVEVTEDQENEEDEKAKEDTEDKEKPKAAAKNDQEDKKDVWTIQDMEKLLHFLSKVFLLNFPLYATYKQSLQTKIEELTPQEATVLSNFCDIHDLEIPIHLLRNVCLFCRSGGVEAMTACFEHQTLPLPVAHAIISVVCNLKLWLNFRSIMQLFIPLRSKVLRYMCNMADKDLRSQGIKAMADFMWSAVKDPMDSPVQFDRDGLDLAFKYFTSSTLTMRLAGISQINSHINMFNEMCNSENMMEVESVGQSLAAWLIDNNIISHIFGPNLHVEVIKQSHIILSFLAMECKLTNEHIDVIWQAAQLKHCSKQVHDLLPPLIKNLEAGPVLHLYHLLCKLEPKDHTEQSLYLASAIIKFLWTSNGSYNGMGDPPGGFMCIPGFKPGQAHPGLAAQSSSDNSNSEGDSSEGHKSDSEASDGPTPRKRPKQRKTGVGEEDSSDGDSVKIEDVEEDGEKGSPSKRGPVVRRSRDVKRKVSRGSINSKMLRRKLKLDSEEVGPSNVEHQRLNVQVIKEKLKAVVDRQKDENSNSVKIDECSEEEEEDEEEDDEEEEEESDSDEEGVMLAGRLMDADAVKVVTDQQVMIRQGSDYIQLVSRQSPDCGQTAVMTELASLVQNTPHCRPFITSSFQPNAHEMMEEMLSVEEGEGDGDGEGSLSSRMSNKSEKNMADFDGEESGCDEELAQFAARAQLLQAHLTPQQLGQMARLQANKVSLHHLAPILNQFNLESVCKPGNTLLWDLLQDDKIDQLGEGLAMEAEKVLCNLLCFSTDKMIRTKFIEGCLENLAKNWSVVVSLRLLPKLFASFQHFRGGVVDTHQVTLWALKEHAMMDRFFDNLKECAAANHLPLTHVQVRLQFLTHIYSPLGLPDSIRLTVEDLDTLWQCLAGDPECSDEFFSWLLRQAKSKEQHALRPETLRHLYSQKLPTLPPETISMTALDLYQQLCNMARSSLTNTALNTPNMDHLWKIALRVNNTDVSMAAIQYLNSYYMGRQLEQENEFVCQCMANLTQATKDLNTNEEASLLCIQRALLLLNTHLTTFKRRYAYHLRRWTIEGHSLGSHVIRERERGSVVRITVQPAGVQDKVTIELLTTDYVAELRAEVTVWWESVHAKASDNEGPLRIITQGQELTTEFDEKTLGELGFKDNQMVFISVGVSRQKKRGDVNDTPSVLPPPPRECLPTLLLLLPSNFEQLFELMQTLSAMKAQVKGGQQIPHTKAQVLSRRVWDILTLLPTSPTLLDGFQRLDAESKLKTLLDPASPQKLMYSLYIVESLSRSTLACKKPVADEDSPNETTWSEMFVQNGGLRHLFDIFMSGVLQVSGGSEWQQDCLACLLKLLCQLGMTQTQDCATAKNKRKRCGKTDKMTIPKLSQPMVQLMNVETVIPRLTSILNEASMPRDPNHYKTGFWGRAQVVQYAMALIVSWAYTVPGVREALYAEDYFHTWLRRLVLEEPEPCVRREVCMALYKLAAPPHAPSMITHLLDLLNKAEQMRPTKQEGLHLQAMPEEGKEPYGPACRDYFWLLCRLVDNLSAEDISKEVIDLESLASQVYTSIIQREYLETRHNTVEDDGLIGLLNLMSNILKHNPSFKTGKEGQDLLNEVFEFLFALPDPSNRHFPKCKSQSARSSAYDLLVELVKGARQNFKQLHEKLLNQHKPGPHSPYPWDYWPHEDGRSDCGYVGLTNLGATCYMASCMQHLYMIPRARAEILSAKVEEASGKHQQTLKELQRMFAYLLESERKAYNPRSFCKVYTMDHQPLNTGEQKDMAEFFIDLVSKLEEMTPALKTLVKTLFGGVISNNVVSLDCDHVSRTLEEFYTVRCQVADMRNLYESLDEVTVKDTLEGDNMYTCSQCGKKVRAEKRACFKTLPKILCFNTMRYTFNMVTMLKEKVNTHFSFPLRLDMRGYVEKHLMPQQYQEEKEKQSQSKEDKEKEDEEEELSYEYELIGVTVHTGTADGGHYYSFIRDRARDKWFLFNDAEVKPFDPKQIAAECFGGEMTSKTYDSVTDKFMDLSFEKTNSAYMLFYERAVPERGQVGVGGSKEEMAIIPPPLAQPPITLSKELEDWIWEDNMHFLRDKNIFEHTYVQFMWQICGYVPQTLDNPQEVIEMAAQLSTTFFIETFIHAKEKPTMVQWVELLTKQFNTSQNACEWFLQHMAHNNWWPVQILVKCPNQMVRQMFQRLCQHVIQLLRPNHAPLFLKMDSDDEGLEECDPDKIGYQSCVTMFIRMLLSLMEHGAKQHLKHLTEYFALLYEFSKMGEEESQFLISIHAISTMVNFYLGQKGHDYVEVVSEEEDEEDVVPLPTDKYKPQSLDKMITLIAMLVEKSRGPDHTLRLSATDYCVVAGSKGFPFLFQQIKDSITLHQTRNLIFSLCRWNDRLANHIVSMIFSAIHKFPDICQPFFKLLTLMVDSSAGSAPGLPCFTQLVLLRMLEVMEVTPQSALDWLALQVPRNKLVHTWVISGLENWLQHYLIAHNNQRVRSAAAYLLVALVPSTQLRQCYRTARPHKELMLAPDAQAILTQVYTVLLRLLKTARHYTDISQHGTTKLSAYFTLLNYFAISRTEKLMFGPYLLDLWQLFHPKLSEPSIPVHHNKQVLLMFWYHVCSDCPENIQLILQNAHIIKNIAFNYILADHEDQEVVLFNRSMLPAYYGLLRLCCQQSRQFTRQLATHQNLTWAFKNITPHPTQYSMAVDELFKLMALFATKYPDSTEHEIMEINNFRRQTLQLYLNFLDGRSSWATLISAFRILVENDDDRHFVVYNEGLQMCFESLHTLHVMYHEATACHVTGDLLELLTILVDLVKYLRTHRDATNKDVRSVLLACKDWMDIPRKLVTLLNTYNSNEMRNLCIDLLKELVLLLPNDVLGVLVPVLTHCHAAFQDNNNAMPMGPYFPRHGHKMVSLGLKATARPLRPMVQMTVPHNQLDVAKGLDPEYDQALQQFYAPYHSFIDVMCRVAINHNCMTENMVNLSAMVGFEAAPLHFTFFPKLWLDIYQVQNVDRKYITLLTNNNYFVDYVETVLLDERLSLNINIIYDFLVTFFPKVASRVMSDHTCQLIETLVNTLDKSVPNAQLSSSVYQLCGDLRALSLVYSVPVVPPPELPTILDKLLARITQEAEESPNKKRKIEKEEPSEKETEEKKPEESKKEEESKASCSKEKEKDVSVHSCVVEDSGSSSAEVDWVERLQTTVVSLISTLQQKLARDETT